MTWLINILFLFDGWDELTRQEQQRLTPLMKALQAYQVFIIGTRPNEDFPTSFQCATP